MSKNVRRLYEQFRPEHYELNLTIDRATMAFGGKVVIVGQKTGRPSQRLTLHQKDLKVTRAKITRHDKKGDQLVAISRVNLQKSYDELRLHSSQMIYPGNYSVELEFTGQVTDGMHGIYPCYFEHAGQRSSLIASQFESHHAREAFPCVDEPEAKATFELTLVTPKGEVVLANTPAKAQTTKNKLTTTAFQTTPKMSTYLLAFVFGELHSAEAKTKDGVLVRTWATVAQPKAALTFGLEVAKKSIEFFNDYFGTPYPLTKCDHVALPDFSSAAMENWGLITYREMALLVDPATASQSSRELVCVVVAHETSHQWFGNLVTMRWWDDLWLNESFANVMEYVATNALFPDWHVWESFVANEGLAAIRRDAIAGVQEVKTTVHHPDQISTLFDPSIVYAKGGRLLNMLMSYVGEADFRRGLKLYFDRHAYGNTTSDELWAALAQATNKDIGAFMNPWLTQSGFPLVEVQQTGRTLKLRQSHFLLDLAKADKSRLWPVPLLGTNSELPDILNQKSIAVELSTPDFMRLNSGAVGHYIVNYTEPKHFAWLAELAEQQKLSPAERLMLLHDSSMLARAGTISFTATLELLAGFKNEASEPVWNIMAAVVSDLRRFIDLAPALEPAIKTMIRQLIVKQYERLGWLEKPNESSQDIKLRAEAIGFGAYAEQPEIIAQSKKLFEAYQTNDQAIAAELRGVVFGSVIRQKTAGAFNYLLKLEEKTTNVDLKQDLMAALCLTKQRSEIERLLGRLKESKKVRPHDIDHWLVFLLRNRYAQNLAWQWLKTNWPWLEKTFGGDKTYDNFPRYAASSFNTRQLLESYRQFFEPLQAQPALGRNIAMGIEELESRVAWLERDLEAVQSFFKQTQ